MINIIFLIVLIFITHIIVIFFHELAHKRELNRNKIKCEIKWNFSGIKILSNFALAKCCFNGKKFDKLGKDQKKKILLSGIKAEAIFLLLFFILSVFSWIYIQGSFAFYYFNVAFLTLIGKFLINLFGKESDGRKFGGLKK
jgi:hypothetical protein